MKNKNLVWFEFDYNDEIDSETYDGGNGNIFFATIPIVGDILIFREGNGDKEDEMIYALEKKYNTSQFKVVSRICEIFYGGNYPSENVDAWTIRLSPIYSK